MTDTMEEVFCLLEAAKQHERTGRNAVDAATKYYKAVYLMRSIVDELPITPQGKAKRELLTEQINQYENQARRLLSTGSGDLPLAFATPVVGATPDYQEPVVDQEAIQIIMATPITGATPQARLQVPHPLQHSSLWDRKLHNSIKRHAACQVAAQVHKADAALSRALDLDETGARSQAASAYTEAAEEYLEALNLAKEKQKKLGKSWDESVESILKRLESTLSRAEQLKRAGSSTGGHQQQYVRHHDVNHGVVH